VRSPKQRPTTRLLLGHRRLLTGKDQAIAGEEIANIIA
jgi:hypothetical protein